MVGREQGVGDLWEDAFEELDMTVNSFILFLELRMQGQHAQEIASFTGAHMHNSRQIDQRQPGRLVPFESAG